MKVGYKIIHTKSNDYKVNNYMSVMIFVFGQIGQTVQT